MKLTISKTELSKALTRVRGVVSKLSTIPILQMVLIKAEDGALSITATDLDMMITVKCEAEVSATGTIAASAILLADIAKRASEDEISIELKDYILIVKSGKSRFKVPTLEAADFPMIPITHCEKLTLDAPELKLALTRAFVAVSTEEPRYYLRGVFFDFERNAFVATDGHRLVRQEIELDVEASSIIVPSAAVSEIVKLCDGNETLELCVNANKIAVIGEGLTFVSKLIDGTYPDYTRVIPNSFDGTVSVPSEALSEALARVSVVSSERGRAIILSPTKAAIQLSAASNEGAAAEDEIEATLTGAAADRYGLNFKYATDMLKIFPAGEVRMHINSPGDPIMFDHEGAPGLTGIIMPVRV